MAFEEITEPRKSYAPKQVYASFVEKSSPAGMTSHRPSASLLKDTPPSIVVALSKLSPIIAVLNTALALLTWTGDNNWSSFLMLLIWWFLCLYGDWVFHYAGNWIVLLILGLGYYRRKLKTRLIVRAIEKGDDPNAVAAKDTHKVLDKTLYEIDCFSARWHLLAATLEPLHSLYSWEDPKRSALIGMRLVLISPLYVATLWLFTTRSLVMIFGTLLLTCTSPGFKVICSVFWRFSGTRKVVSALLGTSHFPGESGLMSTLRGTPRAGATDAQESSTPESTPAGSRFTTAISVVENQRRWLGLGWTPSLLPHERAPYTDVENITCPAPENYGLPDTKTTIENDTKRTTTWKWVDSEWRIERDRTRDGDGWLYFDNSWHHPTATEEYGKYTRRRKWIRNAECSETVELQSDPSAGAKNTTTTKETTRNNITMDPEKVRSVITSTNATPTTTATNKEKTKTLSPSTDSPDAPKREWRTLEGGGRELVPVVETVRKRPLTFRRRSSRSSMRSAGQQSID